MSGFCWCKTSRRSQRTRFSPPWRNRVRRRGCSVKRRGSRVNRLCRWILGDPPACDGRLRPHPRSLHLCSARIRGEGPPGRCQTAARCDRAGVGIPSVRGLFEGCAMADATHAGHGRAIPGERRVRTRSKPSTPGQNISSSCSISIRETSRSLSRHITPGRRRWTPPAKSRISRRRATMWTTSSSGFVRAWELRNPSPTRAPPPRTTSCRPGTASSLFRALPARLASPAPSLRS